jgi:diacylglycerol kinase family enzyme
VAQILGPRPRPRGKHVVLLHDLPRLTLSSSGPLPFQLDGDDLGDRQEVEFVSVPHALEVMA